ncbi:hypothetical protein GJ496_007596 [Pomphorhynchus laevis]|nr:hypothetical protein GJ496_007596 [Pomphorhynchus laevis]
MARLTGRRGYLLYMLKQTSSTSDTSISDELAKEHLMYNCLQSSLRASMQKVINDVCLVGDTDKVVNENCENICRRYRELLDQIKHLDVTTLDNKMLTKLEQRLDAYEKIIDRLESRSADIDLKLMG